MKNDFDVTIIMDNHYNNPNLMIVSVKRFHQMNNRFVNRLYGNRK